MEQVKTLNPSPSYGARLSIQDLKAGIESWRIWTLLGWHDIRLRYRRSVLGPFWITISMAVMIYTLGTVYAYLFKMDISSYFPHLACGMIIWNFFSTLTMECVDGFTENAHLIKQIRLPFSTYILRTVMRNVFIFCHNLPAVLPILFFYHVPVNVLAFVGGVTLFIGISFVYGMALAMLGSRYRDIKQLVQSLLQIIFYLTPIMWMPHMLPERFQFVITLNPVQQMIELIRAPLLGHAPSLFTWGYTSTLLAVGASFLLFLLNKSRHRIPFWV